MALTTVPSGADGGTSSIHLEVNAPSCYQVYIDGNETSTSDLSGPGCGSGQGLTRNFSVVIKPRSSGEAGSGGEGNVSGGSGSGGLVGDLSLGGAPNGSVGSISFSSGTIAPILFTPAVLDYANVSPDVDVVRDSGTQVLRQIKAPEVLADIVTLTATSYEIRFYPTTQVGSKVAGLYPVSGIPAGGLYSVTGSPSRIWRFSSPTNSASVSEIQVTKVQGAVQTQEIFSFLSGTWMAVIPGFRSEIRTELILPNGDKQIDVSVKNPTTGVSVSVTRSVYHAFPWGTEKISSIVDPDGFNLTTRSTYNENVAEVWSYGKLKWVINSDGSWQRFNYLESGRSIGKVFQILRPWNSFPTTPSDATSSNCHVTEYTYVSNGLSYLLPNVGMTVERVGSIIISSSKIEFSMGPAQTDYVFSSNYTSGGFYPVYSDASFRDDNGKITATYPDSLSVAKYLRGRVLFVREADGRQKTYTYDRGTYLDGVFTPSVIGTYIRAYETAGTFGGAAFVEFSSEKTPRVMTIYDPNGWVVSTENQIRRALDYSTINQTRHSYDIMGHLVQTTVDSRVTYDAVWANGRLASETDKTGIITIYDAYDAENRVTQQTRVGVILTRIYDAAGRVISSSRSASGLVLTTSTTYDSAGRLQAQTGEDGLVTTTTYPTLLTTTRTNPDASTEITETFLDGRTFSITGTAVIPTYYGYEVDSNGFCTTQWVGYYQWGRYTRSWKNENGDVWLMAKALPHNGQPGVQPSQITSTTIFDPITKDRPISRTVLGEATILYAYDPVTGAQTVQARDLNANGIIDYTGPDTIDKTETLYISTGSNYCLQTVTSRYETEGQALATVLYTTRQQVRGLDSGGLVAVNQSIDQVGLVTTRSTVINRATRTVTTITDVPDSTVDAVVITIDEKPYSSSTSTVSTPTVYNSYDALGRLLTVTSPRGVVASTTYDSVTGRVASLTQAGKTTSYTYHPAGVPGAGKLATETLPDTKVIRTAYTLRGEVFRVWGGATYPLERTYDEFGQLQFLKTYRAGTGWTGANWPAAPSIADTTEWRYENYTGQLEAKLDAAGNATSFTYDNNGKMATRRRARGPITTYTWNSLGLLASTSHSDGTPTVTTQYDRASRPKALSDAAGTHTYYYSGSLNVSETIVGGILGGSSRDISRTLFQKPSKTSVTSGDVTHLTDYRYIGPRLNRVFTGNDSVTYSYLANSDAIQTFLYMSGSSRIPRLTTTWSYDNSDRLNGVTNFYGAYQFQTYGVSEFDAMNRRKTITREDGTRWNYGYNDKGEVTSGIREKTEAPNTALPGWNHNYTFDEIGNRLATNTNGRASSYTANKLNQITSRTVPRAFDIIGKAATTAAVTVNSQATTRLDEFFYKELSAGNGAVHVPYSVAATDATGPPTIREGGKFLPATPENSIYDQDGNLTSDGRFTYTWDAENRLIAMQTLATVPVIAQRKLAFAYDAMGRRIRKTTWNGTATGTWQPQLDLRFLHELGGWNVLAEITADNKFHRTYTWGPDLSGSQSGAGGVGGLLFSNLRASGRTFAHGMDLNGNVTLLVNTANGTTAATYDYGPFGEPLRQSGEYAKTNPYRFSTKYTDDETGLLDYGRRYYDPVAGRWLSKDPIEEEGGVNLYGFVRNDAINKLDILGEKIENYTVNPAEFVEVESLNGIEGKCEPEWHAYSKLETGINAYGWVDVEVAGKLTIKVTYLKGGKDAKVHEQTHAEIYAKWWNMLAQEINWTETKWCQPCANLVVSYGNATAKYREAQADLENSQFDQGEYRKISAAQHWITWIDARVVERTQKRDTAKTKYDTALKAFSDKCGNGTNMNK